MHWNNIGIPNAYNGHKNVMKRCCWKGMRMLHWNLPSICSRASLSPFKFGCHVQFTTSPIYTHNELDSVLPKSNEPYLHWKLLALGYHYFCTSLCFFLRAQSKLHKYILLNIWWGSFFVLLPIERGSKRPFSYHSQCIFNNDSSKNPFSPVGSLPCPAHFLKNIRGKPKKIK